MRCDKPNDDVSWTSTAHSKAQIKLLHRRTVADIQRKAIKRGKRNAVSRLLHAKNDKDVIAAWRLDLDRILRVFNVCDIPSVQLSLTVRVQTELAITTHGIVSDVRHGVVDTHNMVSEIHQNMLKSQEGNDRQHQLVSSVHSSFYCQMNADHHLDSSQVSKLDYQFIYHLRSAYSTSGELPPQAPRGFFGRDELIGKIIGLVQNLNPIALIGTGGIEKTSIALTVLHNDHIKQKFGGNCYFIRCDQFPATSNHFLSRLSKVIGAGVENPEDLTPLQLFLSSKEMLIVIDNAESILDLQEVGNQKTYNLVEELCQFRNICLCITSRISTIPPGCETIDIPTLSMEAAHEAFYNIYRHGTQSDLVNKILEQLDFHPLSVTLLATVAQHNRWNINRLAKEWEAQRTGMLHVQQNKSLATTIELSLASPMFQELGPNAHALLGVVAFFPQGVDENNLDWLFPTIPNRRDIFDKFCILSLTYQSNGFITMLAPLRDHLSPKDPMSAPLLCMTKDHYFSRLSVEVDPDEPRFEEAKWIISEDVNVEHLLNVFTTIDAASGNVWSACAHFMQHLHWHKPQLVMLGPRIEELPDSHPSKPLCLYRLSRLFKSVGNYIEGKQLLTHALRLWREQGDEPMVAQTLRVLCDTNKDLELYAEGIQQAEEALEAYKHLNDKWGQATSLKSLAYLLCCDGQLDAAEGAALQSINLSKTDDFTTCECYRLLGEICSSKGEREKAIKNLEAALRIASPSNWHYQLFWIHDAMSSIFCDQSRFDEAQAQIEHAKLHVINDTYLLGRIMDRQARTWYLQNRLEEAKSEALGTVAVFHKLGASNYAEDCQELLQEIEMEMNGKVMETPPLYICIYHPFLAQGEKDSK